MYPVSLLESYILVVAWNESVFMSTIFDFYTVIFLGIAVVVLYQLYSLLGWRTERDESRNLGTASPDVQAREKEDRMKLKGVGLSPSSVSPSAKDWGEFAASGTALSKAFDQFFSFCGQFSPAEFLEGARKAYEAIVLDFYRGNKEGFRGLLAPAVYATFCDAIDARAPEEKEQPRFTSLRIDQASIIDGWLEGQTGFLTVRFVSRMFSRSTANPGDPEHSAEEKDSTASAGKKVVDLWTFSRDLSLSDPNWTLVTTENS